MRLINNMNNKMKKIQTILFASLIAALILPFSAMDFADADKGKNGKDIVKDKSSFEKISKKNNHNPKIENDVRIKQDVLINAIVENYQSTDKNGENYFPWSSISYDDEDNSLQVTLDPEEFSGKDLKKYQKIIRSIVGKSIDVSIAPLERAELTSCSSRTNCDDPESGIEIGMTGKDFPCTLGFAATYNNEAGFITAGHCFDGLTGGGSPNGANAVHPQSGSDHIGDLVVELATNAPSYPYTFCDCAFVEGTVSISGDTFGMADASSTGSTVKYKAVKASLSQSGIKSGQITDTYAHINTPQGYYLIGVAIASISVQGGDSGAAIFSSDGSELIGFAVAGLGGNHVAYVKHDKVTQYFSGLQWDF